MDDVGMAPMSQDEMLAFSQQWIRLTGKAQQLMSEFWARQLADAGQAKGPQSLDPLGLMQTWTQLGSSLMADPERLAKIQQAWWQDSLKLFQGLSAAASGGEGAGLAAPIKDKRFSAKEWSENLLFDFIRQSYLLAARYITEIVHGAGQLDPHEKAKAEFYTRQFVDALSPSNFLLTNPQALKATMDSKGQTLLDGLENLITDMEAGRIAMTDYSAFEVGGNVAITPGKVVFENRLFQLIHYAPTTAKVYETPILFFPPWINKFYILDLTAEKSMVKWLTDQGFSVFMVSWVNPDSSYADVSFEDYVLEGQVTALEQVQKACGTKDGAHVIGYCVAGTALTCTLGYLTAKKRTNLVKSATFFTAQVDFSEAGELCIFVDDPQLETIDALSRETGYLDSSYMATTFNMLRSNDLIWSYVVNNYLLGKDPFPFDLLYWNSDSTRLPRTMHLWYLRNMYRDNKLIEPGALSIAGVPIDLGKIKVPTFVQAGKEDHIAPARSSFKITQHLGGDCTFMLAGSGHIAGVVNPPALKKYQYWTNDDLNHGFEGFLKGAKEHPGSWWPYWVEWLAPQSGKKVAARVPGAGPLPAIEEAPGRYVKAK
jgi:polyhydroxyalkanoate synthase subunit PhaC